MNTTTHYTSADTDFELVRDAIKECETVEQVQSVLNRIANYEGSDVSRSELYQMQLNKYTEIISNHD